MSRLCQPICLTNNSLSLSDFLALAVSACHSCGLSVWSRLCLVTSSEQRWLSGATRWAFQLIRANRSLKMHSAPLCFYFSFRVDFVYIMVTVFSPNMQRAPRDKSRGFQPNKNNYQQLQVCICICLLSYFDINLSLCGGVFTFLSCFLYLADVMIWSHFWNWFLGKWFSWKFLE